MKHIATKNRLDETRARFAISFLAVSLLVFSGVQSQEGALAIAPTCASPWFKDVGASNDFSGVLVCDYTVTSGSDINFALNLPEGVTEVYVVAVGGGGGGGAGGGTALNQKAGGGGGAGEVITTATITGLNSTSSITYSVGRGGDGATIVGGTANGGSSGEDTVVLYQGSTAVTARGGQGGAPGDGFTPGGGGQSGSGLSGGTGTGYAGGGGGGSLATDFEWPEGSGTWYRGAGSNGTNGTSTATRKGGNGGEADYFNAPYSGVPISGYLIGQETADTDIIDFYKSTYGGAGGVVSDTCDELENYGHAGFSLLEGGPEFFQDSQGACAYTAGGANGVATVGTGVGSGGGGGAGTDIAVSFAAIGASGNDGALWLRYVLIYSTDGGAGGGGGDLSGDVSRAIKLKPATPTQSQVTVAATPGALNVAIAYQGSLERLPAKYTVTVSPSGNSCVATGSSSSCNVTGLKPGVLYTVLITATNAIGTSGKYVSTQRYRVTSDGLASFIAKRTIDNFAGDSPKLLKPLKAEIRKFLSDNPEISSFTCTGYTAGPVKPSDKALAKQRANKVCAYIEKIDSDVSTTIIGKTPGLPWGPTSRKVIVRGYSAAS